jgi:hypothetical protein
MEFICDMATDMRAGVATVAEIFSRASNPAAKRKLSSDIADTTKVEARKRLSVDLAETRSRVDELGSHEVTTTARKRRHVVNTSARALNRTANLTRAVVMVNPGSTDVQAMDRMGVLFKQRSVQSKTSMASGKYALAWHPDSSTTAKKIVNDLLGVSQTNVLNWGWTPVAKMWQGTLSQAEFEIETAADTSVAEFAEPHASKTYHEWALSLMSPVEQFTAESWGIYLNRVQCSGVHYIWKMQTVAAALAIIYLCLDGSVKKARSAQGGGGQASDDSGEILNASSVDKAKDALPLIARAIQLFTGLPVKDDRTLFITYVRAILKSITSPKYLTDCNGQQPPVLGPYGGTYAKRKQHIATLRDLFNQLKLLLPSHSPVLSVGGGASGGAATAAALEVEDIDSFSAALAAEQTDDEEDAVDV